MNHVIIQTMKRTNSKNHLSMIKHQEFETKNVPTAWMWQIWEFGKLASEFLLPLTALPNLQSFNPLFSKSNQLFKLMMMNKEANLVARCWWIFMKVEGFFSEVLQIVSAVYDLMSSLIYLVHDWMISKVFGWKFQIFTKTKFQFDNSFFSNSPKSSSLNGEIWGPFYRWLEGTNSDQIGKPHFLHLPRGMASA